MNEVYFASIFHSHDHCDHVGIFSSTALAIAGIDAFIATRPWILKGYAATIAMMTVDNPGAIVTVYERRCEDGEVTVRERKQ